MEEKKKAMASKEAFFDDLYKLDDEEPTNEGEDEIALVLKTSKMKAISAITPEQRATVDTRLPTSMARTMSSPVPSVRPRGPLRLDSDDVIDCVKETPVASASARLPSSKQTTVNPKPLGGESASTVKQTKPASKAGRKRKRGQSLELLPESQQIFRGKAFCKFSMGFLMFMCLYIYIHSLHTRQRYCPCAANEDSQGPRTGCVVGQGMEGWHHSCCRRPGFDICGCHQVPEGHCIARKYARTSEASLLISTIGRCNSGQ